MDGLKTEMVQTEMSVTKPGANAMGKSSSAMQAAVDLVIAVAASALVLGVAAALVTAGPQRPSNGTAAMRASADRRPIQSSGAREIAGLMARPGAPGIDNASGLTAVLD